MHSFKANIVAILWEEKFQTIRFFLSVCVCVCVCVCVYIYIQSGPKKYIHTLYTQIYTLPSVLQTTILLQPCWVTVLTIKDTSASQERLCHLLRKY